jgi:hypothetical protein
VRALKKLIARAIKNSLIYRTNLAIKNARIAPNKTGEKNQTNKTTRLAKRRL